MKKFEWLKNNSKTLILWFILSVIIGKGIPVLLQIKNPLYGYIIMGGSFFVSYIIDLLLKNVKQKKFVTWYLIIGIIILSILCFIYYFCDEGKSDINNNSLNIWKFSIIIGGILFVIGLLAQLAYIYEDLIITNNFNEKERGISQIKKDVKEILSKIETAFSEFAQKTNDPNDLFIRHLKGDIKLLLDTIKTMAGEENKLEKVYYDYFLNSQNLDDVFEYENDFNKKFWYFTWQINDENELFVENVWKYFFQKAAILVEKRKIKEIKSILIFPNKEFLQRPKIKYLLNFFAIGENPETSYTECKIMYTTEYQDKMRQNGEGANDFGIYGDHLLSVDSATDQLEGTFIKQKNKIEKYRTLFDDLWDKADKNNSPNNVKKINVMDLTTRCNETYIHENDNNKVPKGELIEFADTDNFLHNGILYKTTGSKKTIIHIHGSYGNFYQNFFIREMAKSYTNAGYNFISFNLRCHDGFGEGYKTDDSFEYLGGAISDWNSCLSDIQGAINYASSFSSEKIILQGHSMGCERVVHYLSKSNNNYDFILLAPTDSYKLHLNWLEKSKLNYEKQIERLLKLDDSDFKWLPLNEYGITNSKETYELPITKKALLSIIRGDSFKFNISNPYDFRLQNRCFIYIGGQDDLQTSSAETMFNYLAERIDNVEKLFVQEGDHMMKGVEQNIISKIIVWLDKS